MIFASKWTEVNYYLRCDLCVLPITEVNREPWYTSVPAEVIRWTGENDSISLNGYENDYLITKY